MTKRAGGAVLRAVRAATVASSPTDRELLNRFTGGDQDAFKALVTRHSGMVLGVCRRALPNVQDAEDACQATFLVLANRARDGRWQESVANWLYTTARRIASRANRTAARRVRREARATAPASESLLDQMTGREAFAALDEELDRLPAIYREPLVLCYLEGLTRDEAASRLGVPVATLKSQLDRGRKKLGDALTKRGVALGAGLLAVMATSPAGASPPRLIESILTAVAGSPSPAVSELVKGVAVNGLIHKVTIALVAVVFALGIGLGSFGVIAAGQPEKVSENAGSDVRAVPDAPPAPASGAKEGELPEKFTYQGRAVGPDGKPVKDAHVFLHVHSPTPHPLIERAKTDADGRFSFEVKRSEFDFRSYEWSPMPWQRGHLIVSAPGLGVAWTQELTPGKDAELQLSADESPLEGRIKNLQGEPVVGAKVHVLWVMRARVGDLGKWQEGLKGIKKEEGWRAMQGVEGLTHPTLRRHGLDPAIPPVTTDKDGRFAIQGLGQERVALVRIEGDRIESRDVFILPRPGDAKSVNAFVSEGRMVTAGQRVTPQDTFLGTKFELTVPPGRLVTGVVTDVDTGKPVAGARVSSGQFANGVVDRYRTWTVTDAEGRYTLRGLPVDKGNLVRAEGPAGEPYLTILAEVPDRAGLEPIKFDLRIKRGIWLTGTVLDRETKKPVQATVRFAADGENPNLKPIPGFIIENDLRSRADNGGFRMPILPGKGYLSADVGFPHRSRYGIAGDVPTGLPEFIPAKPFTIWPKAYNALIPLDVAEAKDLRQDVLLTPGRGVLVTILGPDGEKLKGVVASTDLRGREADQLNEDGTLTVRGISAKQAKYVQAVCPDKKLAGLLKVTGEDKTATLKLQPWLTMKGRVVDEEGQPIADAELSFQAVLTSPDQDVLIGFWYKGGVIRTGKDGTYQIEGLIPGSPYHLFMKARGQMARAMSFRAEWKADTVKDWGDWKPGP